MELDNMLSDLENQGYTAETFLLPACGVGAPHRRNRAWIVAYSHCSGLTRNNRWKQEDLVKNLHPDVPDAISGRRQRGTKKRPGELAEAFLGMETTTNSNRERFEKFNPATVTIEKKIQGDTEIPTEEWLSTWWTIEPGMGRVADGIPNRVDRIRGLGNSVVPQLAYIILSGIQEIEDRTNND
jgi:DNA (cytosine-5)-methyltransferase 1